MKHAVSVSVPSMRVTTTAMLASVALLTMEAAWPVTAAQGASQDILHDDIETGEALQAGDITIVGYRTSNPDGFAFVTWKHIAGGTTIGFWDHSANADDTFRLSENRMTWTAPDGGVAAGTVVTVKCTAGDATPSAGVCSGTLNGLASVGDQIFAGVGGVFPPNGGTGSFSYDGTLLYGLNTHGPWTIEGDATSNNSYLPSALNGAGYRNMAFAAAFNNGQYTDDRESYGTWADYKALIHDEAYWTRGDDGAVFSVLDDSPFTLGSPPSAPTEQAWGIAFRAAGATTMDVAWTNGNGQGRLVVAREGSAPDAAPTDGLSYIANSDFNGGTGTALGGGRVVYLGAEDGFTLQGLMGERTYFVRVFEYNGYGSVRRYATDEAADNPNSETTTEAPSCVTPGNLLVYTVDGDGAALGSSGTVVKLREYTPAGVLAYEWILPYTGADTKLTASGTANSEGKLTVSPNGVYAALAGYDAEQGTADASAVVNRTIARLDIVEGTLNLTTSGPLGGSVNARGVAVDDTGTKFWAALHGIAGAGDSQQGLRYLTLGQTTTGTQLAGVNTRGARLFGGQLYQWGAASDNHGIFTVGSGFPEGASQVLAGLPGLSGDTTLKCCGFYMADLSEDETGDDTLWMARDSIGVTKYSKIDGTWVENNTLDPSAPGQTFHIDGRVEDDTVHLYLVVLASGATRIMKFADGSGHNRPMSGSFANVVTSAANQAFRGVAVVPKPLVKASATSLSFGKMTAGMSSIEQSYIVSATALNGDLIVTAPAGFEISTARGAGFGPRLILSGTDGVLNDTTIHVRFVPSAVGAYAGRLSHANTYATPIHVAVSGAGGTGTLLMFK